MTESFVPGQLVQSIAGRDSGKYFLIIGKSNGMINVADGKMRKVQRPKKKNVKHLKRYDLVAEDLAEKLRSNKGVTNSEVEKAIKNFVDGLEGKPC